MARDKVAAATEVVAGVVAGVVVGVVVGVVAGVVAEVVLGLVAGFLSSGCNLYLQKSQATESGAREQSFT